MVNYSKQAFYIFQNWLYNIDEITNSNGRFDPEGTLNREMLAAVLYRMESEPAVTGTNNFTGTADGAWYAEEVLWASQQGIMGGYGNGKWGIGDPVTRQDMATHDGYGAGSSYSAIRNSSSGATVEQGLAIDSSRASVSEGAVTSWLNGLNLPSTETTVTQPTQGETTIRITIEGQELEGVLYDSAMARQFIAQLPQTITMTNYGGREVYGGIDRPITVEGEGQLRFDDGDITYCPANNTAAIFYSQSSRLNLTMTVYPIGKVTSGLSIFPDLPSRVEITFEVIAQ